MLLRHSPANDKTFSWPPVRLETKIGHEVPALVLDNIWTFEPLERGFGVFAAERGSQFVIGFGGG